MKMKSFSTAIMAILFSVMFTGCSTEEAIQLNDDVLGLIVFKSAINDPFMHLSSWNQDDASPCAWSFITCNQANGRVTEISLNGLNLSGKIGRGLEKLQFLKVLSLSGNNFTGSINPELAFINGIEKITLSQNSLSGHIPDSFANMSSLQFLDLSMNSLSGPVSDNLFQKCFSLRFLSLSSNLLEGPIPSSLTKCTTLNHINISNNQFSGNPKFSSGVWSLTRLRTVDLSTNQLSGVIPNGISVLHNLKELFLQGNHFSGSLPADIGLCPHLSRLDFSYNRFSGELPATLQMLKAVNFLSLSNNLFTGDFPSWISDMYSLEYVDFSENGFMGSLPIAIGNNLKSLKFLSLSNNKLSGNIPNSLFYCSSLSVLRLTGNSFSGSIPAGLFDMGLKEIDLSRNQIRGSIPRGSSRLFESLQVLDLSGNNLTGKIPTEMGLFSRLSYLNLSGNYLDSRMPPELGFFENLTVLDLRNSGLVGPIPTDICDSGSLEILQLDGNLLTGPIPQEIGNCSSLNLLSLSHNNLSGFIPRTISLLKKLEILKLEVNQLSGEIPQELGKLENLLLVNVSYNRLVGRLPAGSIFPNLDETAIEGNLGICSPLLKGPCKMDVPKPLVLDPYAYGNQIGDQNRRNRHPENSTSRFTHHSFLSVSAIVAISASVVIALGVILISLLNASARRSIAFIDNALESMCSSPTRSGSLAVGKFILFDTKSSPDWISTSLDSVLNKASEIGSGVFGTVYRASLGGDEQRIVAVKKLVTTNTLQYQEEFDREVRVLAKVRHPNLMPLRGYYWTPQMQLLVSDYAIEGSLQSRLHERGPTSPPLLWPIRFKIVLGAAKGLVHLHHSFRPPIVHYNVKPSNILLDENLNPKISDFGLARLLTKLDKHVLSNRFQSAPGYMAPEVACQSLRVNEKCDVYGFGMLILELVTGRRPVEYGEDNVVILADHVRALLEQGNALDCVDPSMGNYAEDEVLPVLKLALVCTSQIPSSRPSMAEVVQILQVINTPVLHRLDGF